MSVFGRVIILLAVVGLANSANVVGQDSTKSSMRTFFGGKSAKFKVNHLGLYFAPEFQYGQLDGSFTPMAGASVMLQVNKKWGIGMMGFGGEGSRSDTTKKGGSFGGLKLEYTPKPDARIHVSFPLMLGAGETGGGFRDGMGRNNGNRNNKNGKDDMKDMNKNRNENGVERSAYAVIQPGITLEANVLRYARVFAGANYRFAFNSDGYSSALQGFSTNAGLKIGIFDYSLAKRVKKEKVEKGNRRGRKK